MRTIELTPCQSSNVAAWGYQDGTLAVQFRSGATYHYEGVPAETIERLRQPDASVGGVIAGIKAQFPGVPQQPPEENLDE